MEREARENLIVLQVAQGEPSWTGHQTSPTVYFDGSCPLCSVEIRHYKSRTKGNEIAFVDVSDPCSVIGNDLTQEAAMHRLHVRRANGELVSGARAFAEIWNAVPGWRWAGNLTRIRGVLPLLELGYRAFLPVRPLLSRIASLFGAKVSNPNR